MKKFEPKPVFVPCNKDWRGWHVRVTFPDGDGMDIGSFATEADARAWIREGSALWLEEMRQSVRRYA